MPGDDSISGWIRAIKDGDEDAAQRVWDHFFARLVVLARRKLPSALRRIVDEEDVVLSVFQTLFRRASEGRFPRLNDRHDLWQLLVTITERKASNKVRDERRIKRGGGRVVGESAVAVAALKHSRPGMEQLASREPTPAFVVAMSEAVENLLGCLDDEQRALALLKLEGYTNLEIATRIGRSVPTIERRLRLVRAKWQAETV